MPTNLIANPGFETDTTGWSTYGTSTFERVTTNVRSGVGAGHVVFDGATGWAEVKIYGVGPPAGGKQTFVCQMWLKGTGTCEVRVRASVNGFTNNRDAGTPVTLTSTYTMYETSVETLASDTIDTVGFFLAPLNWLSGSPSNAEIWVDDVFGGLVSGIPVRHRTQFELRPGY